MTTKNILSQAWKFISHNRNHDHTADELALYRHIEHIDEPVEAEHCRYCDYDVRTQQETNTRNWLL